jgi:hypothetical protein
MVGLMDALELTQPVPAPPGGGAVSGNRELIGNTGTVFGTVPGLGTRGVNTRTPRIPPRGRANNHNSFGTTGAAFGSVPNAGAVGMNPDAPNDISVFGGVTTMGVASGS